MKTYIRDKQDWQNFVKGAKKSENKLCDWVDEKEPKQYPCLCVLEALEGITNEQDCIWYQFVYADDVKFLVS